MARIKFKSDIIVKEKERIKQGDYIYCKASGGAYSFWGIYGFDCGVVSLDGAGNGYIPKGDIYLGEIYSHWLIEKRIPVDKVKITIEEIV